MPKVLVGFSGNPEETLYGVSFEEARRTKKNLARDSSFGIGGTSVNLATGLLHLSRVVECQVLITVGQEDDEHRQRLQSRLTDLGVDYHLLPIREGTNFAVVLVDSDVGPYIFGRKFPYISHSLEEVERLTREYEADLVAATGVTSEDALLVQAMFLVASKQGTQRLLNPRDEFIRGGDRNLLEGLLRKTDLLIVNGQEAASLLGRGTWIHSDNGLEALHAYGIREVIVTLGRNGAFYSAASGETLFQPAVECGDPVDHTGAGDSFTSGFLTRRLEGGSIEDAMRFAATVAGIKVTRQHGSSVPHHHEVVIRLGQ